jgi:hypothetical protein
VTKRKLYGQNLTEEGRELEGPFLNAQTEFELEWKEKIQIVQKHAFYGVPG